jgi:aliphatic nitrilase
MPATYPAYRAAAVQAAPAFLDLDAGIEKATRLIAEASAHGAKLVAFPETWFPGYPFFLWLDSPAWTMQFIGRYHDNSLAIGSPEYERLAQAARDHHIMVSLGFSERSGGSLYLAQALIDEGGQTVYTRRKLKPTHVERTLFGEGDGSDLHVAETKLGRIGGLCCWEHIQPLSKYAMYSQNEQVHVAAWPSFSLYRGGAYALGPEVNTAASRMYAVEGQCFVLAPCGVVSPEMIELMCTDDMKRQLLLPGGGFARIFAPDGRELGEALPEDAEGLVYADLDLGFISLAKNAADPAGHYSRPDVTRLLFDSSRHEPVIRVASSQTPPAAAPAPSLPPMPAFETI